MRKLTVKYEGEVDDDLDRKIVDFLHTSTTFRWYAQGFDLQSKIRDIAFEGETHSTINNVPAKEPVEA